LYVKLMSVSLKSSLQDDVHTYKKLYTNIVVYSLLKKLVACVLAVNWQCKH